MNPLKRILVLLCLCSSVWADPTAVELCQQGESLLQSQKSEECSQKFQQAITVDPKCARAYYGLGQVTYSVAKLQGTKFGQKAYTSAVQSFSKVIELEPDNFNAYESRAKCYMRLGR